MKKKKHAATVWKGIVCVVFLFIALFPIYWLAAMSIRLTDEMKGHISVIPHSFTLEHFAQLFEREGFGAPHCAVCHLCSKLSDFRSFQRRGKRVTENRQIKK